MHTMHKRNNRILTYGLITTPQYKGYGSYLGTVQDKIQDGYKIFKIQSTSGDAIDSVQTWTRNEAGNIFENAVGGGTGGGDPKIWIISRNQRFTGCIIYGGKTLTGLEFKVDGVVTNSSGPKTGKPTEITFPIHADLAGLTILRGDYWGHNCVLGLKFNFHCSKEGYIVSGGTCAFCSGKFANIDHSACVATALSCGSGAIGSSNQCLSCSMILPYTPYANIEHSDCVRYSQCPWGATPWTYQCSGGIDNGKTTSDNLNIAENRRIGRNKWGKGNAKEEISNKCKNSHSSSQSSIKFWKKLLYLE